MRGLLALRLPRVPARRIAPAASDEVVDTALLAADGSPWRAVREALRSSSPGMRERLRAESRPLGARRRRAARRRPRARQPRGRARRHRPGVHPLGRLDPRPRCSSSSRPRTSSTGGGSRSPSPPPESSSVSSLGDRRLAVGAALANLGIVGYDALFLVARHGLVRRPPRRSSPVGRPRASPSGGTGSWRRSCWRSRQPRRRLRRLPLSAPAARARRRAAARRALARDVGRVLLPAAGRSRRSSCSRLRSAAVAPRLAVRCRRRRARRRSRASSGYLTAPNRPPRSRRDRVVAAGLAARRRAAARATDSPPPDVASASCGSCSGTGTSSAEPARTSTRARSRASGASPATTSRSSARSGIPSGTTSAARASSCPSCPAACCPSSSSTATRGSRRGCSATSRRRSGTRTSRRTPRRCASSRPRISCSRTTSSSALRSAPRAGMRFRVKAHGSELEYAMRGRPDLARWGAETLARGGGRLRRARSTSATCSTRSCGHVDRVEIVPPGVDVDEFRPEPREEALAALVEEARAIRRIPQRRRAASRRGQRRALRGVLRATTSRPSSTSGS